MSLLLVNAKRKTNESRDKVSCVSLGLILFPFPFPPGPKRNATVTGRRARDKTHVSNMMGRWSVGRWKICVCRSERAELLETRAGERVPTG